MQKYTSFSLLLLCFLFAISSTVIGAAPVYKLFSLSVSNNESYSKYLKEYTFLNLNTDVLEKITNDNADNIDIEIPVSNSKKILVSLHKSRVLSDGFRITTPNGDIEYQPGLFYQGKITGQSSTCAFSFFNASVMGVISFSEGNYVIGSVDTKNQLSTEYIIYNDANMLVQNPFECHVEDKSPIPGYQMKGSDPQTQSTNCKMIEIYLEADYNLYSDKGSNVTNVTNYVTGLFNVVAMLYTNESINIAIKQLYVWTTPDPFPDNSSSSALTSFQSHLSSGFNGDIAHLLSTTPTNLGGISYVDVLCNQSYGVSYSNIYNTYSNFPTYSWSVEVVSHEMGHAFGSQHTHWCGWQLSPSITGPIDTCYTPEGGCYSGPSKPKSGTIMSYCHLTGSINFNSGFGQLPGDLIRSRYNSATCAVSGSGTTVTASGSGNVCVGSTANLYAAAASGSTYSWTGPAGFTSTLQNPSIANVQSVNSGTYAVSATYNGCTSDQVTTAINVNQYPSAPISPTGTNAFCSGGSIVLSTNVVSGNTYQWKKNGNNIAGATNASYIATTGGKYKVTVTNLAGCSKTSAVVDVVAPPGMGVTASGSLTFCAGGSVTLTAVSGAGYSYQWRLGGVNISGATSQSYTATAAGTYTCIVTNSYGCSTISAGKKVVINCRLLSESSDDMISYIGPNPFTDNVTINLNSTNTKVCIKLYDAIGKQLFVYNDVSTNDGFVFGEELMPGIYMAEVTCADKKQVVRIIKK